LISPVPLLQPHTSHSSQHVAHHLIGAAMPLHFSPHSKPLLHHTPLCRGPILSSLSMPPNHSLTHSLFWVLSIQILCMHGGLSPELKDLNQIKRVARPTDVPDSGLLCDLLWADPDKDIQVCALRVHGLARSALSAVPCWKQRMIITYIWRCG
jgi:hypothetical protein